MHENADLISIARISSPHGIKGALNVRPYGSDHAFLSYSRFFIPTENREFQEYRVVSSRLKKPGSIILVLAGVDDRNRAEELAGSEIYIKRDMLPEPDDDEDYWQDLIGLRVVTQDGSAVGVIKNILETAGHDIYVVRSENGKEILIPAVKDIVRDVNLEKGVCVIEPPDGLLDVNA